MGVIPFTARCAGCNTRGAWYRPHARYAGVVPCGCGRRMREATLTAARAAEHAAVADAAARPRDRTVFGGQEHANVVPIYRCGAAKRQAVRRLGSVVDIPFLLM